MINRSIACVLFFFATLFLFSSLPTFGDLPGVEVGVGEYADMTGINIKVLNWGFVENPPEKWAYTIALKSKNRALLRIDLMLKNSKNKAVKIKSGDFAGSLISKDERSFDVDTGYDVKEAGNMKRRLGPKKMLPGQPISVSLFLPVDEDIVPAKLVLSADGGSVIRFFLQQNLPEEEIEGTTRQSSVSEQTPKEKVGEPVKKEQETELVQEKTQKALQRKATKSLKKMIKF